MRHWKQFGSALLALLVAVPAARAASLTIPAGTTISVRMTDALDSSKNRNGETFRASLDAPVMMDGKVVVPKGAEAIGRITTVEPSGHFRGRPVILVELTALNFEGKSISILTSTYQQEGTSRTRQTAKIAGGATIAGAVIGFVAGGPWLGTALGGAAGMAVQRVRGPSQIRIPAESLLLFTLQSPLPVENGAMAEASVPAAADSVPAVTNDGLK
jgi:hypothetical protein